MLLVLTGCAVKEPGTTVFLQTGETSNKEHDPERLTPDMLSQNVYRILQDEWKEYDALGESGVLTSSKMPGHCTRYFDDWKECEQFIGISIANPLENRSDVEKGTYVGMPIGYMEAPRVQASWYGTRDGRVEWIRVQSGYRLGEIRIVLGATLHADPPEEKSADSEWPIEPEYLVRTDDDSNVITEDRGERYIARTGYVAQEPILYSVRVIGETTMQKEVQETLDKILPLFEVKRDDEIVRTVDGGFRTYYEMGDGSWQYDGRTYRYRLEISGRMNSAVKDSTFVYLSNLETITFDQAWKAAGYSSLSTDYFPVEEAVLVERR